MLRMELFDNREAFVGWARKLRDNDVPGPIGVGSLVFENAVAFAPWSETLTDDQWTRICRDEKWVKFGQSALKSSR